MKAYCFVPEERIDEIRECGMDFSYGCHFDCKVTTNKGMCFMGRLNPRDYERQEFLPGTVLIKVDLSKVRGFIGEGQYFKCDIDETEKFRLFDESLVSAEAYKTGMYRNPLCIIVNAVLPDGVEPYDNFMDEAIPYRTSEELYVECLFSEAGDRIENFREIALTSCFDKMVEAGKMEKTSYGNHLSYKIGESSYILRKG
ncbi:MAG: hypothetical protein E7388_07525 [Ruminococcaceae bacterium]|nr:hypothetical protein [Oscillospiraceae bacterium]